MPPTYVRRYVLLLLLLQLLLLPPPLLLLLLLARLLLRRLLLRLFLHLVLLLLLLRLVLMSPIYVGTYVRNYCCCYCCHPPCFKKGAGRVPCCGLTKTLFHYVLYVHVLWLGAAATAAAGGLAVGQYQCIRLGCHVLQLEGGWLWANAIPSGRRKRVCAGVV